MKGIVLGYDSEAEAIVLRAEDGRRHRFPIAEWRDKVPPRKGDTVDFEPDGERARQVYLTGSVQPIDQAALAAPLTVVSTWAPARFFLTRPVLTCALFLLLACFVGAYAVGDDRISVLQAPDLIARMSEALDSLIAASGADPAPRIGAGIARLLLVFLLGLYAVPVMAVLTLWREFVGRPSRVLAEWTGLAAVVLPVGLPLIVSLVVQIWVIPGIPDTGARLGRSGVTTPQQVFEVLRLYATGTVILMFAGAALWAAATGRLSASLGLRMPEDAAREVIRPRPASKSEMFVPLRDRRAAAYGIGKPDPAAAPAPAPAAEPAPAEAARPPAPAPAPERRLRPFSVMPLGARAGKARPAEPTVSTGGTAGEEGSPPDAAADSPPPFLKVGPVSPPPAEAKIAKASEADLPPRGGSVWPVSDPDAPLRQQDAPESAPTGDDGEHDDPNR